MLSIMKLYRYIGNAYTRLSNADVRPSVQLVVHYDIGNHVHSLATLYVIYVYSNVAQHYNRNIKCNLNQILLQNAAFLLKFLLEFFQCCFNIYDI